MRVPNGWFRKALIDHVCSLPGLSCEGRRKPLPELPITVDGSDKPRGVVRMFEGDEVRDSAWTGHSNLTRSRRWRLHETTPPRRRRLDATPPRRHRRGRKSVHASRERATASVPRRASTRPTSSASSTGCRQKSFARVCWRICARRKVSRVRGRRLECSLGLQRTSWACQKWPTGRTLKSGRARRRRIMPSTMPGDMIWISSSGTRCCMRHATTVLSSVKEETPSRSSSRCMRTARRKGE